MVLSASLIHIGVILHQCIFSKVPHILMGLTLLCWWDGRIFFEPGGSVFRCQSGKLAERQFIL